MLIFPWSATGRYVRHLEEEVEFLRAQLGYEKRSKKERVAADQPPASLMELCARFETHGARLLTEAKRAHATRGIGWEDLEAEIRRQVNANTSSPWEPETVS